MYKRFKIQVFCEKADIRDLIKKAFNNVNCELIFHDENLITDEYILGLDAGCDCVIVDCDTSKCLREKLHYKFYEITMICLPSLDSDECFDYYTKHISEPLKLSELKKAVDEALLLK